MNKLVVYISGPYTKGDPILHTREAIKWGEEIIKLGHVPIVPHLAHLWHLCSPHDYRYWMDYDLDLIKNCNVNVMMRIPGESNGADEENELAKELNIPIFYCIEDFKNYISN